MCNLANLSRVTFWRTFSNSTKRTNERTTQFFLHPHFVNWLNIFLAMCVFKLVFHLLFDFNFLFLISLFILLLSCSHFSIKSDTWSVNFIWKHCIINISHWWHLSLPLHRWGWWEEHHRLSFYFRTLALFV